MNSFLVKLAARVGRWSVLRLRQREKTHSVLMCGSCCSTSGGECFKRVSERYVMRLHNVVITNNFSRVAFGKK